MDDYAALCNTLFVFALFRSTNEKGLAHTDQAHHPDKSGWLVFQPLLLLSATTDMLSETVSQVYW